MLIALIEEYLDYVKSQQGLARTSRETWGSHIRAFAAWLADRIDDAPALSDVTKEHLDAYVVFLNDEKQPLIRAGEQIKGRHKKIGLRPRTIRSIFCAIRAFLEWARLVKKILDDNPARGIVLPKLDAPVRPLAEDAEVLDAFEVCDRLAKADPRRGALAQAILSILVMGGLRRSEMLRLTLGDIKKDRLIVRAGKGEKRRVVYPHPDCMSAIQKYLLMRPRAKTCERLFMLDGHRPFGNGALRTLLRQIASLAGLPDAAALLPHTLRHWNATNMLHNGADMEDVKEHLGHSNIATTAVYVHSSEKRRRQIAHTTGLPQPEPPATPPPAPQKQPPVKRGEEPRAQPVSRRYNVQRFHRT